MRFDHRPSGRTAAAVAVAAAVFAPAGLATAPPVGRLPTGPVTRIQTSPGELVAVALPHRSGGRVWRIARPFAATVLRQVTEGDVGNQVVLVFKATGPGTTTISFGLTRGEQAKAYESRRYIVTVKK